MLPLCAGCQRNEQRDFEIVIVVRSGSYLVCRLSMSCQVQRILARLCALPRREATSPRTRSFLAPVSFNVQSCYWAHFKEETLLFLLI